MGLEQEPDPGGAELISQFMPAVPIQNNAEVANWHGVAVDGVGRHRPAGFLTDMSRYLMAKEIEIDPGSRFTPDPATEQAGIEGASLLEFFNREGEVKWIIHSHG